MVLNLDDSSLQVFYFLLKNSCHFENFLSLWDVHFFQSSSGSITNNRYEVITPGEENMDGGKINKQKRERGGKVCFRINNMKLICLMGNLRCESDNIRTRGRKERCVL